MNETKGRILDAAMRGVRLYGLDGVTIQQISELAGISAGSIYRFFDGKEDLMRECFCQVDRRLAHIFDLVKATPEGAREDPEGEIRRLWQAYFRWLVDHPDQTVFYHRFRDGPGFAAYDAARDTAHFASFRQSVERIIAGYRLCAPAEPMILWTYVLTCTLTYAHCVVERALPQDGETEEAIFHLLMGGLRALTEEGQTQAPLPA